MRTRLPERTTEPFDERFDAQFAGNLRSGLVSARVSHGRRMGDDAERTDLRQVGDQFVGHAIRKKLLIRIARKIQQGKDGNGPHGRLCSQFVEPPFPPVMEIPGNECGGKKYDSDSPRQQSRKIDFCGLPPAARQEAAPGPDRDRQK